MIPGESINYEVHITCDSDPLTFANKCREMNLRPVHAHNIVGDEVVSTELLTQSAGYGSKEDALADMEAIANRCRDTGLRVIREKVEIDPSHEDAPLEDHEGGIDYLEAHIRIVHLVGQRSSVLDLRDELEDLGLTLWASYNTFKRVPEGSEVTMLTARSFTQGLPNFKLFSEAAYSYASTGFTLRPLIIEWAIADNNSALDGIWIRRGHLLTAH
jgi:hypothetical protein